jgi:hypothetical protein
MKAVDKVVDKVVEPEPVEQNIIDLFVDGKFDEVKEMIHKKVVAAVADEIA